MGSYFENTTTKKVMNSGDKKNPSDLDTDSKWAIAKEFLGHYGLVSHQLDSYAEFINFGIPRSILSGPVINARGYTVIFGQTRLLRPHVKNVDETVHPVFPKECVDRGISYFSALLCDMVFITPLGKKTEYKDFLIGWIPVMVLSQLCNLQDIINDPQATADAGENITEHGGYFIVSGSCKVIASQQRTAYNKVYVFRNRRSPPKFEIYSEIRSTEVNLSHSTTFCVGVLKGIVSVVLPHIDRVSFPLGVVFAALGVENYKDVCRYISDDSAVLKILTTTFEITFGLTQREALLMIGTKNTSINTTTTGAGKANAKKQKQKDSSVIQKNSTTDTDKLCESALNTMIAVADEKKNPSFVTEIEEEKIRYAVHLLEDELLPHMCCPTSGKVEMLKTNNETKLHFIGYMTNVLLQVILKKRIHEDRDHFANKRLATTGTLMTSLFSFAFKRLKSDIVNTIEKSIEGNNSVGLSSILKPNTIKAIMSSALTINSWGSRGRTKGISQQYDMFNIIASLSNARKYVTNISEDGGKIEGPRHLHPSQLAAACCAETPEGKTVGLVCFAAAGCIVSTGSDSGELESLIRCMKTKNGVNMLQNLSLDNDYPKVFINGKLLGMTKKPLTMVRKLVTLRRSLKINPETSCFYSKINQEVHFSTDAGRFCRAALIVKNGELVVTKKDVDDMLAGRNGWDHQPGNRLTRLMEKGFLEIIDKTEEESLVVVTNFQQLYSLSFEDRLKVTHMELHPSLMWGIGAGMVPYPNRNQSPRVAYNAAMSKQAIGIPGTNYMIQTTGTFHVLSYPQKPIVTTKMMEIIDFARTPTGTNVCVAITSYDGFNLEDSIVIKKEAVERGCWHITKYTAYEAKVRDDRGEHFEIPDPEECSSFKGDPSKLSPDGFVQRGQEVRNGDILIGVVATTSLSVNNTTIGKPQKPKQSLSVVYCHKWGGRVHLVQRGTDAEGYSYIRVVVAQSRPPIVGDKFSIAPAQKGVCNLIVPTADLPFTEDGITPDVIVNALWLPTRMTIGSMLELLSGIKISSSHRLSQIPASKGLNFGSSSLNEEDTTPPDKKKYEYTSTKSASDATAFDDVVTIDQIMSDLAALGINCFSRETLTDGRTGNQMDSLVFTGVCYHQRLRHMVIDKEHARPKGGRDRLTRQPKEGRKAGGGLRVGVMEKDNIYAQGAPMFGVDRLMEQSDETLQYFCKRCGLPVVDKEPRLCTVCKSHKVALVKLPYGARLWANESLVLNCAVRVITTDFGKPGDSIALVKTFENRANDDNDLLIGKLVCKKKVSTTKIKSQKKLVKV